MTPTTSSSPHSTWGGPSTLSAWDAVMWRAEGGARTTSTGMLVELLESEPNADRFRQAHRDAVKRIPRLRERVVELPVPIGRPQWSLDPHFDLDYHLRSANLGGSATHADLLAYCEDIWNDTLERDRPPWVATLVDGLADGKAAYIFKCHHSLTDGMGLVQLMELTHDGDDTTSLVASVDAECIASTPAVTPNQLLLRTVAEGAAGLPSALNAALISVRRALKAPRHNADQILRYSRSLGRLLGGVPSRSPLLAGGGRANRLLMLDLDLGGLKRAGRAAGGSVNDAYVAAILGGLRRYHEKFDVDVELLPVAMPISLRSSGDPGGGNRFAGVRFAAPLAEPDPVKRIRTVGAFVQGVRNEAAITYLEPISTVLSHLPKSALIEVTARATAAADLQISNIPGLRRPTYLAGARVVGTYPFGPRPGIAAMITMMTLEERCYIGINVDARAFPDTEVLHDCLKAGFDEVLNLGHTEVS